MTENISSPSSALVEEWLHGHSAGTQRAYRRDAQALLDHSKKAISDLTVADVQAFMATRTHLAPASRNRALAAVKSLLRYAHETGAIARNVGGFVRTERMRETLTERILTADQVRRMIDGEPEPRNRAMLQLLYAAGLRVSELCGLRWRDASAYGDSVTLTIFGKGSKTRYVLVPASIWNEIRNISEESAPPNQIVFGLAPRQVERIVKYAAIRAGLPAAVSPHWLRHAHATHAIERGAPIHLVQATLGHASVATTSKYLHARPQDSSARYLGL